MRRALSACATLAALAASAGPAAAHAFGQRYDLPLPLDFYLAGGAAVVLLTFAIAAAALRAESGRRWQWPLPRPPRWLGRLLAGAAGFLGVLLFVLVLAAGLLGSDSPTRNIAPVIVWVLWWVGLLLLAALVGNAWPRLDPWGTLWRLAVRRPFAEAPRPCCGTWPATVLLFLFAWLELASEWGEEPRALALLVLAYSAFAWLAMALVGEATWRAGADPFRRIFGLFGRFAPLGRNEAGQLVLRPPGAGLLGRHPRALGEVAFVLLVLATVTFDGLSETPLWAAALDWLAESRTLRPLLLWLSAAGVDLLAAAKAVGLLLTALGFFLLFALVCRLTVWLGGAGVTTGQAMRAFALSFLPIAIAYHGAHYLSYLLLAGQLAIPLASDPLGLGWDLLGTRGHAMDIGVIGARTVWYVAVFAIVTGHAIAVTLAHVEALALFRKRRAALLSQIPMLLLMLAFTATSLWILAQPIVQEPG